jgi:hypothetical protein
VQTELRALADKVDKAVAEANEDEKAELLSLK